MSWDYDVIVVGAGIAGATSTVALAQKGYRVLLLDRETFPRHKPCGEGIMPQGATILESLGLLPEMFARGAVKADGIKFRSHEGVWAGGDFPKPESGLAYSVVMRRYLMDHFLVEQARRYDTVTVREGFRVVEALEEDGEILGIAGHLKDRREDREEFHAPLTLGADGMRSVFHNQYGITRTFLPRRRFGVAGHLRGVAGMGAYIEVFLQDGSEVYIAPCDDDLTLVAILIEEKAMKSYKGNLVKGYMDFLRATDGFSDRIQESVLVPPVMARGPFAFDVSPIHRPGLLLIGDSAGFLDPITGEGMTIALKSVQAALPIIDEAFAQGNFEVLEGYAEERMRIIEDVFKLTQLLLELTRFKGLSNRAIRHLSRDEGMFHKLMGIVTGTHRYRDLTLRDKLALGLG